MAENVKTTTVDQLIPDDKNLNKGTEYGKKLLGKDLSKADVSVNIWCFLEAQRAGKPAETHCAIGDEFINGIPYTKIVETARNFIEGMGGFEKFAEWGLF